jgi:hypothetical protein
MPAVALERELREKFEQFGNKRLINANNSLPTAQAKNKPKHSQIPGRQI